MKFYQVLWIPGWIFFFQTPVNLTRLLLRSKRSLGVYSLWLGFVSGWHRPVGSVAWHRPCHLGQCSCELEMPQGELLCHCCSFVSWHSRSTWYKGSPRQWSSTHQIWGYSHHYYPAAYIHISVISWGQHVLWVHNVNFFFCFSLHLEENGTRREKMGTK